MGFISCAPAGGQTKKGPVGRPVAGTGKFFGIDKGLKPVGSGDGTKSANPRKWFLQCGQADEKLSEARGSKVK